VKSKLSGSWQVISVLFDLYPRPVPVPIENLRPARETCEQCHWPTKFVGDQLTVRTHYENDAENTETKTVLLLRVGGVQGRVAQGIHWHVDPGIRIRYLADESRETIYDVEMTLADGTVKQYRPAEQRPADNPGEWREMDCIDCHNRPTHIYRLPEQEVDAAIEEGSISRSLPYVRKEGIRLMKQEYASHAEARQGIADGLEAFYRENYPDLADAEAGWIGEAARVLGDLYCFNVFPSMNLEWGTYPDHIGHEVSDGCYRCHNDEHETESGEVISQDCETCHTILAYEEENPEILEELKP
jgi:hypothetical protein